MPEEKQRTRFMTVMGEKYALWTNVSIVLLTLTGLLLVYLYQPSYFTSFGSAIKTQWGYVLTVKIVAVALMYGILYGNNLWHGKKFPKLAEAGKFDELKRMRRIAHILSFITVGLMVVIILIAEILAGVFF
ncbi:MAG: CopD family protein [Thermoplasmata archaeon]